MHVVRIGMRLAGQHFAYYQTFQSSLDSLNFFHSPSLQTDGSQCGCHFVRGKVEVDVFFQPVIRNIHIVIVFYNFPNNDVQS